jgi:hypothetical protein
MQFHVFTTIKMQNIPHSHMDPSCSLKTPLLSLPTLSDLTTGNKKYFLYLYNFGNSGMLYKWNLHYTNLRNFFHSQHDYTESSVFFPMYEYLPLSLALWQFSVG